MMFGIFPEVVSPLLWLMLSIKMLNMQIDLINSKNLVN